MINRVVPAADLDAEALGIAGHIAAIDPGLVKETKSAINRALEAQGMLQALEAALEIDLAIEGQGSPNKIQFLTSLAATASRRRLRGATPAFPKAKP